MEKFEREVLVRLTRLEAKIDLQDYKGLSEKAAGALLLGAMLGCARRRSWI